ncbi:MAG: PAS domain-containing protein, partial [Boseongicola sp.]
VHALADGRNGLLMVADTPPSPSALATQGSAQATSVLESLPVATVICDENGAIGYANAMARNLFGETALTSLVEIGAEDVSTKVFDRARRAGIASSITTMATGFGNREIRVTAKPVTSPGDAADMFSLILEDVTDRRALERALPATGIPLSVKPATGETTASAPANMLADLRRAIETSSSHVVATPPVKNAQPEAKSGQTPARAEAGKPTNQIAAPAGRPDAQPNGFGVAEIVRTALSAIPRAIVLYRAGKVVYTNQATAKALGYASENDLIARHDIASTLGALAGKKGSVVLERSDGRKIGFSVDKSTFPWNDGAMPMAVLIETEDGLHEAEQPAQTS